MNAFIEFIMGPMVWISFLVFFCGVVYRFYEILSLVRKKESFIFSYMSAIYSLRSIVAWLIPFLPISTRKKPVFYAISYLFHLFLFLVPIFLMSHMVLFYEAWNISWITLNDTLADGLTVMVILALCFFLIRRIIVPEARYFTDASDYVLIFLVALPFITGFIAWHQFFWYRFMVILHVISGEIVLMMIPFSRLSHMILAPLTRAYTGSEFGRVRNAKDW